MFKIIIKLKLGLLITLGSLFYSLDGNAQFPPPVGEMGTTAIHKDSSVFVAWATGCEITLGYQDISNHSLGLVSAGTALNATGKAGQNNVVSLGDGGEAILTFEYPIYNGPGWDFAVFENGFSDDFLELAFVEVSSDGINYFRFPATSLTQDSIQINGFGTLDATKIDNFAGKYRVFYGTPFDLEELKDEAGLDINAITHIKIIDVIGCIQEAYANNDQFGNIINDPWPTAFPTGGFDLDAVGVIHSLVQNTNGYEKAKPMLKVFPNPANDFIYVDLSNESNSSNLKVEIINFQGVIVKKNDITTSNTIKLDVSLLNAGIYFIKVYSETDTYYSKFIKR